MSPVRKPQPVDHSVLNEMLAIRLQQLEIENGGTEAFLPKTGLARGTSSLDFGSPFTHEETSV